jgi:hypothetical protein
MKIYEITAQQNQLTRPQLLSQLDQSLQQFNVRSAPLQQYSAIKQMIETLSRPGIKFTVDYKSRLPAVVGLITNSTIAPEQKELLIQSLTGRVPPDQPDYDEETAEKAIEKSQQQAQQQASKGDQH